jgi:redox-sensitive bicupin YhaK (pirin superfamily)
MNLHRMIYVYEGELTIGEADKALKAGQLGQLIDGDELGVQTKNHPARFLLLAAMPLKEPVVQSGPFVMNSQEEIDQAFRDYRDGLLTL